MSSARRSRCRGTSCAWSVDGVNERIRQRGRDRSSWNEGKTCKQWHVERGGQSRAGVPREERTDRVAALAGVAAHVLDDAKDSDPGVARGGQRALYGARRLVA